MKTTLAFIFCLLFPATIAFGGPSPACFQCSIDSDCGLVEAANCCMPWFTAVNNAKIRDYEAWAAVEQLKHIARNCVCPQDIVSGKAQFLRCKAKLQRETACKDHVCVLPLKDQISELEQYCKRELTSAGKLE